jgi:hypothetical protein
MRELAKLRTVSVFLRKGGVQDLDPANVWML